MTDKKFVIDSIKMDLYRVVTATGDIRKEVPKKSVEDFLDHALLDFKKVELNKRESILRQELKKLKKEFEHAVADPFNRLKWAEDVLTVRCRL